MTQARKPPKAGPRDLPPQAKPVVSKDRFPTGTGMRRAPLSAAQETALGRTMEEARGALATAVVHSPVALRGLSALVERAVAGQASGPALLADADALAPDALRKTLEALRQLVRACRARKADPAAGHRTEELVRLLVHRRLSESALDSLEHELEACASGHARAAVGAQRTLATVRESRAALNAARATFVEANIGLVVSMATKRSQLGLPLLDLIQEGSMGIMRAADKFDYRRGVRFSTYAGWWIRHALNRALSDHGRTIRIPVHLLDKHYQLRQHERELTRELGRVPTDAELAEKGAVPVEKVRVARSLPQRALSLDAPVGVGADATFGDLMPDSQSPSALEEASSKHLGERLRQLLHTLSPREQDVLRLRFGIDAPGTLTLQEIGDRFSVSRERIRQIEAEALAKLRARAESEELDSMLT